MAEERWNDGRQYGLAPIGLPQADLATPGSDTKRRAFPGLATKSSVFAWNSTLTTLCSRSAVTGISDTVNIRRNTATNGVSADVPTWAAGAVIILSTFFNAAGAASYYQWMLKSSAISGSIPISAVEKRSTSVVTSYDQVIIPFYDEPLFTLETFTDTGTGSTVIYLVGFVRNV